jgi:hypothetical protein
LVLAAGVLLAAPAAAALSVPPRSGGPSAIIVPAVSSNAHRGDSRGNYGGLKQSPSALPDRSRSGGTDSLKQPYPYRYYGDTNRSSGSCYWMARRAIETDNRNWWARYLSCPE